MSRSASLQSPPQSGPRGPSLTRSPCGSRPPSRAARRSTPPQQWSGTGSPDRITYVPVQNRRRINERRNHFIRRHALSRAGKSNVAEIGGDQDTPSGPRWMPGFGGWARMRHSRGKFMGALEAQPAARVNLIAEAPPFFTYSLTARATICHACSP